MPTERINPPLTGDERETLRAFPVRLPGIKSVGCVPANSADRRIERAAQSLDVIGYSARWGKEVSLRLVMLHLIHEYARHNGHADFLREGIDGTTGV